MNFIEVTDIDYSNARILNIQEVKDAQKARYSGNTHIVMRDGNIITVSEDFESIKRKIIKAGGSIY